jgi:drug/metabolite transporter (DMT)-like permease
MISAGPDSVLSTKNRMWRALIVVIYVALWVSYTMLIRHSADRFGEYPYNPLAIVLICEVLKAVISLVFIVCSGRSSRSLGGLATSMTASWRQGIYFTIPAILYAIYNFLSYTNLQFFNPIEFKVLINIRILLTGVCLHFVFGRPLSGRKWLALLFLFLGCVLNQTDAQFQLPSLNLPLASMVFQAFLSTLAGIYNEFLLKNNATISIHIKNLYLYTLSILFNLIWIGLVEHQMLLSSADFFRGFSPIVYAVIVVGSLAGLTTSVFLRYLDVILKEYAHSAEIFSTACISWIYFGVNLTPNLLLSLLIVTVSVYIYNTTPTARPLESALPTHSPTHLKVHS